MTTLRAADWNTGPAPPPSAGLDQSGGSTGSLQMRAETGETAVRGASPARSPSTSGDLHTLDIRPGIRAAPSWHVDVAGTDRELPSADRYAQPRAQRVHHHHPRGGARGRADSRCGNRARRVARPAARHPDLAEGPHRSAGDRHNRRVAWCLIGGRLGRMHRSPPPCGEPGRCSSARRIFTSSRLARPATSPHSARSAILWIPSGQPAGRAEVRRLRWPPACRWRPSARTPADRSGSPPLRAASWG